MRQANICFINSNSTIFSRSQRDIFAQMHGSYLCDTASTVRVFPAEKDGCLIIVIINDSLPERAELIALKTQQSICSLSLGE